ncbi:MAG: UDP-N-acetylmuramate dehydrogenase, partial [Anaerolineales bacterium]
RLQREAPLARYTSARIGGSADYLLVVHSADELAEVSERLWSFGLRFRVMGGGSNVLVSDAGCRGVVVLNQARTVRFEDGPQVWAESGASLGSIGRRSVERGLTGLEWAATVPGTVGGAVVGNAGAHGSDTAGALIVAEILQHGGGRDSWPAARLEYGYRMSWLKANPGRAVVLSGTFRLEESTTEKTRGAMDEFVALRRATQPTGASWGSMFKNPPDDHAGRLIDAAGLKGLRRGNAQVSEVHANFFVNLGGATAADVWALLQEVRERVQADSGVRLELEIERIGEWPQEGAESEQ